MYCENIQKHSGCHWRLFLREFQGWTEDSQGYLVHKVRHLDTRPMSELDIDRKSQLLLLIDIWVGHSTQRKLNVTNKHSCFSVRDTKTHKKIHKKILMKKHVEYALELFFPSGTFPSFGRYYDRKTVGKVSHTKGKTSKQIFKWAEYFEISTKCFTNLNDSFIRKHTRRH